MPANAAKRHKISVACQRCRTRKLRCDGGRPSCMQCTIGQSECEWPAGGGSSSSHMASTSVEKYDDGSTGSASRRITTPASSVITPQNLMVGHPPPPTFALLHDHQPGPLLMGGSHTTPPFNHGSHQISPSNHSSAPMATPTDWHGVPSDPLLQGSLDVNHAGHVPDLGWMMNELGMAYEGGSVGLGSHATESPTSSSATGTNDLATRSREAHLGLDALTREEIFARAFGTLARACRVDEMGTGDEERTRACLQRASRCLSSRFEGLENIQEQVVHTDAVQQHLHHALADVGEFLQQPSANGVIALILLAWVMYGEGDRQACYRYARTAYLLLTYLDEEESGIEVWILNDLLMELALRGASADLAHITQQMRDEVAIPESENSAESALLTASLRIQQSAYDLGRYIAEHESNTTAPASPTSPNQQTGGSKTLNAIFDEAQEIYSQLGISLRPPPKGLSTSVLDEIETNASTAYENMPSSTKFNVNNFAKHDRIGQGTEFLAVHIKYEALMCTVCQVRAFAAAADPGADEVAASAAALEELRTGASAARSLADDLVVAEAVAPWCVAANPSLDRYILIAALGVLILFKATTGRWTILAEEKGVVHARKRLLSNVLRQNFSACLRALQLLSKYWTGSKEYTTQLEQIIAES